MQLEQGVFHDLAERRVDPVLAPGHLGHAQAGRGGLYQRLDQQRGLVAQDVSAEELSRGRVGVQRADALGVPQGPAVGGVLVGVGGLDVGPAARQVLDA